MGGSRCHRTILPRQRATPPLRRAPVVATRAPLVAVMLRSISCRASWFISFAMLPENLSWACLALRWPFVPPSTSTARRHPPSSASCMARCGGDRENGLPRCGSRWGTQPCRRLHRRSHRWRASAGRTSSPASEPLTGGVPVSALAPPLCSLAGPRVGRLAWLVPWPSRAGWLRPVQVSNFIFSDM
jgi:hypothetical protein